MGNFSTNRSSAEIFKTAIFVHIFSTNWFFVELKKKAILCGNLHRKQLLCKFPKKNKLLWKFVTKQIFVEIFQKKQIIGETTRFFLESFQLNKVLWICSNKATFCGNFPTKPVVVEILQPSKVLWKFTMEETSLWKFSINAFLVDISHKGKFLWKFPTMLQQFLLKFFNKTEYIFLYFAMKTVQPLERILRQNSVNFGENFRKIHKTAKNFHAATLPRCKGFCYSGRKFSGP